VLLLTRTRSPKIEDSDPVGKDFYPGRRGVIYEFRFIGTVGSVPKHCEILLSASPMALRDSS